MPRLSRRTAAEFVGTCLLVAAVVGSGIMGDRLAGGNIAIALLANTGLNDFLYRENSPAQGRWLSPDPYLGSMDLTNPQSLNRYAYVTNDPMNQTDRDGLCGTISAGVGESPDTPGGQLLEALAFATGSNVAFGYANENPFTSVLRIGFQAFGTNRRATSLSASALVASNFGSDGVVNFGFSGGAQSSISAEAKMGISPSSQVFVMPGLGLAGGPIPSGSFVYRGKGLVNSVLNQLTPGGNTIPTDCSHDIECVLRSNSADIVQQLKSVPACSMPLVFTPRGIQGVNPFVNTGGGGMANYGYLFGGFQFFISGSFFPGLAEGYGLGMFFSSGMPPIPGPRAIK